MEERDDYIPGVDNDQDNQEPPEGGSSLSQATGAEPTAQTQALDQLPKETVQDLLKTVHRFGVREDDPLWVAILAILHTDNLVESAQDAATRVETAGANLGKRIFDETVKAGGELKATISEASVVAAQKIVQQLTKGIVAAITKPFGDGVKGIETALGEVDSHIEKERAVILATWRKDLASAAAREARRRSLIIATVSWGTILVTCGVCIVIGAGGMFGALDLMHKIVPWGLHLVLRPSGDAACGVFHDALVCGVTH